MMGLINTLIVQIIVEPATTLFLFTKSDVKTMLIPVTVFAVSTTSLKDKAACVHLVHWIWLHLLQCTLANQTIRPEEDVLNKPDRPIPAGRVTIHAARLMRWGSVPACLALSAYYGLTVFQASGALAFFLILYNELEMSANWLGRTVLNAVGIASFEVGASLIAGGHSKAGLDTTLIQSITISSCIYLTTIHAQDFKDIVGDTAIGRRTLPMVLPKAGRMSLLLALTVWSIFLVYFWRAGPLLAGSMLALAALVGGRFLFLRSVLDDQKSFYLYNAWFTMANAFPALVHYSSV